MYKEIFSYNKKLISKKNGKYRTIYVPNENLKKFLRSVLPELEKIYDKHVIEHCDHAFIKGKNCVTNASSHIHQRYVLSLDIENFFESLPSTLLEKYIPVHLLDLVLINNKIVQGLPTSPYLANIAMIEIDAAILNALKSKEIVYSRYADDLTFSFNDRKMKEYIIEKVVRILRTYKLKVNPRKTKLQDKENGRAIVTGIGVSMYAVYPTRKTLKKIRAAQHQKNVLSEQGLTSWSLCKLPKNY